MMKKIINHYWLSILIGLIFSLILTLSSLQPKIEANKNLKQDLEAVDSLLNKTTLTGSEYAILKEKHRTLIRSIELRSSDLEIYGRELIAAIFYFLVTALCVQIIIDLNKNYDSISIIKTALKEYKLLIEKHNTMKEPYATFISKKVRDVNHLGGIAFISFCEESYIEWLIESLEEAKKSYEATLTYKPGWFFIDEPDGGLTTKEKTAILSKVKDVKHIKSKTRILIYKKEQFIEYFEELDDKKIEEFIELNENCSLYYADKIQVEGYFQRTMKKHKNAIEDDFALIDSTFVLKKDNHFGGSIIFGDVNEYVEFFKLAKDDSREQYFRSIDSLSKIKNLINEFKNTK